jgi:hypothetical protein
MEDTTREYLTKLRLIRELAFKLEPSEIRTAILDLTTDLLVQK